MSDEQNAPMIETAEDLASQSGNVRLFEYLRTGQPLEGARDAFANATGETYQEVNVQIVEDFREALLTGFGSDNFDGIDRLIEDADLTDRLMVCAELTYTLYALHVGEHPSEVANAIAKRAFTLAQAQASSFEQEPPQDTEDEHLIEVGLAMRECAHLLAGYFALLGEDAREAEMLLVRARLTNCAANGWPNLVGAAMIDAALAFEKIGDTERALQFCQGVRDDLRYLTDEEDDAGFPEIERVISLSWYQRACEEYARLASGDGEATEEAERVARWRGEMNYPDADTDPRPGAVVRFYVGRATFLRMVLTDILVTHAAENKLEQVYVCHRYGCFSPEVDFYFSAISSYSYRNTMMGTGMMMMYDPAHLEVFAALDDLLPDEEEEEADDEDDSEE